MTAPQTQRPAVKKGRRWTFWLWSAITLAIAAYLAIAAPFATYFHENFWLVAVIVPPVMILLLGLGLGWLIWVSRGRRGP